jgi:DtxR family Mn-dependent transcriptional regulator
MPKIEVNQTIEDYLRSMFRLESRDGKTSNAALAKELAISSSAVTEMARRLAEGGLLSYQKYQGLKLTKAGRDVAVSVTRRHRLWEVFLIQHLGFEWDEVHALADQLEHIGSEELVDRLEKFLGYPTHDPHGDPIPNKKGEIKNRPLVPLAQLEPGDTGTVARVSDEFPELLRYASSLGLSIAAEVRVVERIAFDCSVRLLANGREAVVSEKLANSVFLQLPEKRRSRS